MICTENFENRPTFATSYNIVSLFSTRDVWCHFSVFVSLLKIFLCKTRFESSPLLHFELVKVNSIRSSILFTLAVSLIQLTAKSLTQYFSMQQSAIMQNLPFWLCRLMLMPPCVPTPSRREPATQSGVLQDTAFSWSSQREQRKDCREIVAYTALLTHGHRGKHERPIGDDSFCNLQLSLSPLHICRTVGQHFRCCFLNWQLSSQLYVCVCTAKQCSWSWSSDVWSTVIVDCSRQLDHDETPIEASPIHNLNTNSAWCGLSVLMCEMLFLLSHNQHFNVCFQWCQTSRSEEGSLGTWL